ncbi:MAG: putative DNA binding domain-containing protein [Oscillospiraceae bacterium]|jgi:ATP-dependent DNA helicase RecG|nr:putative DNA binding domain-containing protein [Oscillospiraceae bacterium]
MNKNHEVNNVSELLEAPEGEHYQFKEAKERFSYTEALKICCALSNGGGGKLVLGITDKRPRKVVNSKAFSQPERTREGLMNKLRIKVDFQLYEYEKKRILVFEVATRPIGHTVQVDGVAWYYKGDSLEPIPPDILRDIYFEAEPDFSGDICHGATLDDIDKAAVDVFRTLWVDDSGNKRIKNISTEQLMIDCGVIINDKVTYAALILFGKNKALMKYLPQAEIIFEYRSSNAAGPAQQREEFRVGFFASYDRIWELIDLRNDLQHYQDGFQVLGIPTFNERATREALLNTVSHRSYRLSGSIFIKQYRDRLVFDSPGGFPSGITVNNILEMQSPRNHLIVNVFALCGLVERAGQGMNLMYELCIKEGKALPDFKGSDSYFVRLTLNGMIKDEKLILLFKRIENDVVDDFITEDFLIINSLFYERSLPTSLRSRAKYLTELGVTEHIGRGRYILAQKLFEEVGGSLTHSRQASFDREENKKQILIHVRMHSSRGTPLRELMQLLPNHSRSQIQKLLYELRDEGKVRIDGKANKSRWYSV